MQDGAEYLTFTPLSDPPGLEAIDRVEQRRYKLHTPELVAPTPAETDPFRFPIGRAIQITTSELVLPAVVGVYARDEAGSMVAEVEHLDEASLPEGAYTLELATQIKTYIKVDSAVEITADVFQTRIDFSSPTEIRIGARSRHRQPASTVTTTADPVDVMAAVETFGATLKTTDPERSFPTLRGHPPAIELGDTLEIPPDIEHPDTGVQLELPPDLSAIYVAAPLAHYLGADVVPGPAPRLTTENGFEYCFDSTDSFEADVERTLKQVFFLDCVTRVDGYFQKDLHEREAIEPYVDLDFPALYEQPLAEQVASYLEVPFAIIEEHIPQWRLTAHVQPVPDSVEQLPFVVNDLAAVRTPDSHRRSQPTIQATEGPGARSEAAFSRDEVITRAAAQTSTVGGDAYVEPEQSNALEQAWIGDNIPIGASKLTPEAFRNRFAREATDGDVAITIVLNDARMGEERDLADDAYGDRDDLPFDVTVRKDLTVAQLRELLREPQGFFHFIGHTEKDGLECVDGKLDATTLDETGVEAFLLNSCNSYHQGLALVEAGAIGGIVTLNDVINDDAVLIGESIARLLNAGFPLRAALNIAREQSVLGGQYIVVGDGGMTVTQPASVVPYSLEIEPGDDCFDVTIMTYATDHAGLGATFIPFLPGVTVRFLSSGEIGTFQLSKDELLHFLTLEKVPVKTDGDLYWSSSILSENIL